MSNSAKRAFTAAFTIEDLDAVVGGVGLQAPQGGSIRESTSNYSWYGMNYQQTTREALDSSGNVVGTETYRPGSVWSDRTTQTSEGSTTEYSTGGHIGNDQTGAGFNASFSTHHDADGNLRGVDAQADGEAHAHNTGFGDYTANGSAQGSAQFGPDGSVDARGHAQGELTATDPNSGYGVALRGEANGDVHLHDNYVAAHGDAKATGAITENGEDLVGVRLGEVGGGGRFGADENGDYHAQGDFRLGALGERFSGSAEGTYAHDGTISGSGDVNFHAGTENARYSASVDANAGVQGTYHPDGSVDAGFHGGGAAEARAGNWSGSAEVSGSTNSHFDENHNYQGTDLNGEGRADVNGPNGFNVGVNGSGEAHYDQDGNLTGASGEGGAHANVGGQEYNYSTSGSYDPNGDQQQSGGGETSLYGDHSDQQYAYDANSHDDGSSAVDHGSYDQNGSYQSNDSGSVQYASNDSGSDHSNDYSAADHSNDYQPDTSSSSSDSGSSTDYASNDSGSSYDSSGSSDEATA